MRAETIATASRSSRRSPPLSPDAIRPRDRTEETAQRLTLLAIRHWERALGGIITVPAAAALTTGAALLFAVSIVERTFELFDWALAETRVRIATGTGESFDAAEEPPPGDRARPAGAGDATWMASAAPKGVAAAAGRRGATVGSATSSRSRAIREGSTPATSQNVSSTRAPSTGAASRGAPSRGASSTGTSKAEETSSPVRRAGAVGEGVQAPVKAEEAWDVVLTEAGDNPIALMRELRELTGRDLRELELLVNSIPDAVTRVVTRLEAESWRERIEAAGGRVDVRRA